MRSGRRGFTLIELIAVIAIAAILAATAVPALSSLGSSRATAAGRQLLHDLSFARQRAVASGTRCWVAFDTAAETWSVLGEDADNPGRVNAALLTDPATGGDFVVALGVAPYQTIGIASAAFDGDDEIGFDWLGRPLNGAEASLAADGTVALSSGHQITVTAVTGHITFTAP